MDLNYTDKIRDSLNNIFNGFGVDNTKITITILKTPADAFGTDFWNNLVRICSASIVPFAISLMAFFVAAEFYKVYCKNNGEIDAQLVVTTGVRFILPYFLISRSYTLIGWIYDLFNRLIIKLYSLITVSGGTIFDSADKIDAIMAQVEKMSFVEKTLYYAKLNTVQTGMDLISVIITIIIYGRLFEIMLHWLISPIPLATMVSEEHGSQIGLNFLKIFASLMLQGVLMFLCVAMYTGLKIESISPNSDVNIWSMLGFGYILVYCLIKTGPLAKRVLGTF